MAETVAEYFARILGQEHDDETLAELPVDSPCGQDCRKAIDGAAAYLTAVAGVIDRTDNAVWDDVRGPIMESVSRAVSIYWRG